MQNLAIRSATDALAYDASVGDAYNAVGYAEQFSVRGFMLNNNSGYRKDGIAIPADTQIPLENKERLELRQIQVQPDPLAPPAPPAQQDLPVLPDPPAQQDLPDLPDLPDPPVQEQHPFLIQTELNQQTLRFLYLYLLLLSSN
jgi:hypothetical protein